MAGLIKDQHGSGSLPSFPDIFQSHYSSLPNRDESQDNIGSPEDIDELDKEISQIVEQATASGIAFHDTFRMLRIRRTFLQNKHVLETKTLITKA